MSSNMADAKQNQLIATTTTTTTQSTIPDYVEGQTAGRCMFFEIAPELRNRIYSEVFAFNDTVTIDDTFKLPAILKSSKQIHAEATGLYYSSTTFRLTWSGPWRKFFSSLPDKYCKVVPLILVDYGMYKDQDQRTEMARQTALYSGLPGHWKIYRKLKSWNLPAITYLVKALKAAEDDPDELATKVLKLGDRIQVLVRDGKADNGMRWEWLKDCKQTWNEGLYMRGAGGYRG